jgi:hypothetical protein
MALFTAEGLLRASTRFASRGVYHPPSVVHHAYMRWLKTQGETPTQLTSEIGLAANREWVFELGTSIAALTHGHPSGFLSDLWA